MVEINNTTKQKINLKRLRTITEDWLKVNRKSAWDVSIAIVGSSRMKRLNCNYRGIDKTTDVLSFVGEEANSREPGKRFLGEVIINFEEVKKANKYLEVFGLKKTADYIFYFLLIHGLLHLIGHEDEVEAERQKMLMLGEKFLRKYF